MSQQQQTHVYGYKIILNKKAHTELVYCAKLYTCRQSQRFALIKASGRLIEAFYLFQLCPFLLQKPYSPGAILVPSGS